MIIPSNPLILILIGSILSIIVGCLCIAILLSLYFISIKILNINVLKKWMLKRKLSKIILKGNYLWDII
jgi:hypothetical protein